MIEHDKHVGQLLDLLDELGIAEDTIVMYSTDNGPHINTWPDGAMTPFRNEKNSNWEGAFRVPEMVRWPGQIPAGVVSNEIISHTDWLPTLLAAAGEPEISEKLKQGHQAGDKQFKVLHRRLQLPALLHRPGGQGAAPGDHLLLRRRRPGRAALRQLEVRLRRAARPGYGP
jgi:arylsulfatase A-like enzyme